MVVNFKSNLYICQQNINLLSLGDFYSMSMNVHECLCLLAGRKRYLGKGYHIFGDCQAGQAE